MQKRDEERGRDEEKTHWSHTDKPKRYICIGKKYTRTSTHTQSNNNGNFIHCVPSLFSCNRRSMLFIATNWCTFFHSVFLFHFSVSDSSFSSSLQCISTLFTYHYEFHSVLVTELFALSISFTQTHASVCFYCVFGIRFFLFFFCFIFFYSECAGNANTYTIVKKDSLSLARHIQAQQ